jgi:signal transduction histidine kinase
MDQEALVSIGEISKSAKRAASLTQQLLAYSRKQVLRPEVLNINQLVSNVASMLRRLIHENISLNTVLDPSIGSIRADPAQLEQVIINLVINAGDSMPEGGSLTIETKAVMLDHSYSQLHSEVITGEYVMMAVTDTGCGIDERIQKQIFEPFFTTKEPGKGTGLGLATVFGTVKQSNGYIYVYSEPEQGSTFKIYLPVVPTPKPKIHDHHPEALRSRAGGTILLVEDDEPLRNLISRIPGLRVLFISGYPNEAIVQHGVLAEDVAYLQKPFSPKALIQVVEDILAEQ